MKKIIFLLLWNLIGTVSEGQITQRNLDFQFVGTTLSGVLNVPEQGTVKGIVLIVHGSGRTNALEQNWHADVRGAILRAGYATYMWDKMGCGKSGGTFDPHQLVESSAAEVIAAIRLLKEKEIPGSDRIG
ncbi:MAG: alpha/beta hydrolase, partial [Bacteroidota bacterium]